MSSMRPRRRRQRATRVPGVWRGRRRDTTSERPTVEHGVRDRFVLNARMLSGLIVVALILILMVFFLSEEFYVNQHHVVVRGVNYLDEAQVFDYAGIAEIHLFWGGELHGRGPGSVSQVSLEERCAYYSGLLRRWEGL